MFLTSLSITLLFTSNWIAIIQFLIATLVLLFINFEKGENTWILAMLLIPVCTTKTLMFFPILLAVYLSASKTKKIILILGMQTALWGAIYGKVQGLVPLAKYNHPIMVKKFGEWLTGQLSLIEKINVKVITPWINSNLISFSIVIIGTFILAAMLDTLNNKLSYGKLINELIRGVILALVVTIIITIIQYEVVKILNVASNFANTLVSVLLAFLSSSLFITTGSSSGLTSKKIQGNVSRTNHGWQSISGYDDVKEEIKETILPYINPLIKRQMINSKIPLVKGMLLYGPPGVGKTLFAKAIAAETKMKFINVKGSEFTSKYVGESEENLRNIFAEARQIAPCVIFFDEIESFLRPRNETKESWEQSIVTTFLAEMDGFNELKDVLIIAATNHPDKIDSAAIRPGRFDKIIFIAPPDAQARKAIWNHYLKGRELAEKINIDMLVDKSYRYTAADIEGIINETYRMNKYKPINAQMLMVLLEKTKPTVSLDMLDYYEKLSQKYGRRSNIIDEKQIKERRKYSWNDIAGMSEVKQQIRQQVELPFTKPEVFEQYKIRPTKGVLLYGPPGCGKTLFAKVLSDECNATYFSVKGPELLKSGLGQSEDNIRRLFREARENKPAIIFFDEIDSIGEKRGNNSEASRIVNQLLTEMDGVEGMENIIVVAATNRLVKLDSALLRPGRFDNLIYIGIPDKESREAQLLHHLKDRPYDLNIGDLADLTEGYSGAELEYIVNQAAFIVVQEALKGDNRSIRREDFEQVLSKTPRSITEEELSEYETLKRMQR